MENKKNIFISFLILIIIIFIVIFLFLAIVYVKQKFYSKLESCKYNEDCKSGFVCKKQNLCTDKNENCITLSYCEKNISDNINNSSSCGDNICDDNENYMLCRQDCLSTQQGAYCELLKKDISDELKTLQKCSSNDDCIKEINPIPCEISACGMPYDKNLNISFINDLAKKYNENCPIKKCPETGCLEGYRTLCIDSECKKIITK